jgi:hypothetical protein
MYPVICKYIGPPTNVRIFTEYPKGPRHFGQPTKLVNNGDLIVAIRDNIEPYGQFEALILPFEDLIFGETPMNAIYRWKSDKIAWSFSYISKENLETLDGQTFISFQDRNTKI